MQRGASSPTWGRLAASWCVIFGALHVYWAVGGSFGLAQSAGVDLATRRPAAFVLLGLWGVALLLLIGAGLGTSLTRPWISRPVRRVLRGTGLLIGAALIVRGVGLQVVLLTDAGGLATAVGRARTVWSLAVWNPWFAVGGVLFALAAIRAHNGCQSSNRFPSRS